jgi:DNA-binding XRE family transcriptional regulator
MTGKVSKTAIVWDLQPEKWRRIGLEFAAECAAIAAGAPTQVPPFRASPSEPTNDLRRLRLRRGLSQRAVAALVGCNQTSISDAELGRASATMATLIRRALEG